MRRLLFFSCLLAVPSSAAVRWPTSTGASFARTDFANIQFKVNAATLQTLGGARAMAAIQAALNTWNAVPNTSLHFAALTTTDAGVANDGQNVIAFATTPETIASVGQSLAVTQPYGFTDGRVVESDIILNPNVQYSTTLQSGAYDLQSIITHELGHCLGANHATSVSSTMFWLTSPGDTLWSRLKPDDAAFAAEAYPGPGASSAYGKIQGTVTKNGLPVTGAAILATDPSTGVSFGGLSSLSDGTYSLTVAPGNYQVWASPVTPFTPLAVLYGLSAARIDSGFQPAQSPSLAQVSGGSGAVADIAVPAGGSALSITSIGTVVSGNASWRPADVELPSGQSTDIIVFGPGLDASITEQNITLIGPGVSLHPGSLRIDTNLKDSSTGLPPLRFTVDLPTFGMLASDSLAIRKGSDAAFLTGGLVVLPPQPVFTAASLVDAASSQGAGVAPGELVSLYGANVGPDPAVFNSGFDAATGLLASNLAGLTVSFDGIAAPLLYAASGQVNLQVPYEVSGQTVVIVNNQGSTSAPVTVPVLAAHPGLFNVAVNQDGSINAPNSPAPNGTYVTFYATGAGAVTPAVPTGKAAPSTPLSFAQSASVNIGGLDALVYQGGVLAPGFVGLLQVAAQIPQGVVSGSVPVTLSIAGQTSPAINIYTR